MRPYAVSVTVLTLTPSVTEEVSFLLTVLIGLREG